MAESESRAGAWVAAAALPVLATVAVFGWAYWCFGGATAPSATVAVVGGAVLILAACAGYALFVGGSGGLFGALVLALGLLLTVGAADRVASRGAVATCVVRDVRTSVQHSVGEGAPAPKTVYRLALDCPGGQPGELKGDRAVAVGAEVRVAYDPRHRVAPEFDGTTSPWRAASWALMLLALSTVIAGSKRAAAGMPGPGA